MKNTIIFTTIIILLLLFIKYPGSKKGFNKLLTYWIVFTILFYTILYKLSPTYRFLFIFLVMKIKILWMPVFTVTSVFLSILGSRFKTYRMCSLTLYKIGFNLQMNIENIQQKPTIYMANYPSNYVEYMTHGLFGDKFCLLVHHGAMKGLKYIYGEEYLISVQKGNFEKIQKQVKKKIEEGFSIFCYVERDYYNRKSDYNICELRSGIFSIAKNINATITPVCIDHITYTCGIVDDDIFKIKIGDTKYVFNVEESLEYVKQFLKNELKKMKSNKIL